MRLTFLGATHEVTGSCYYLEAAGKKFLVDCGMEQGPNIYENKPIECVGYALGVYQLCRMNGVSASVLNMIDTTDNIGHAADLVAYSDGKKYVDMAFDEIKNTIPKKYSVYFNSSNQKN